VTALTALALTSPAAAEPPVDVQGGGEEPRRLPLPAPPASYVTETRGTVTWTFPAAARHVAEDLMGVFDARWEQVVTELGGETRGDLTVRIALDPEHMRALAPERLPPPPYATGVAYPDFDLVLVSLTAPDTWARPDVEQVLVHELSHLALYRTVGGAPLPRWFVEGVAIRQAEEASLDRIAALWNGSYQGRLIPLADLDGRFPERPHEVNLAYAQAADLVAYLWNQDRGPVRFRKLLRRVREGSSFDAALDAAYSLRTADLEREWRASVAERRRSVPLLVGGSSIWVLARVLAYLAWRRRRAQFRVDLRRMAQEEAALDRIEALVEDKLRSVREERVAREAAAPTSSASRPLASRSSDPDLPTIVHDGESHTLH